MLSRMLVAKIVKRIIITLCALLRCSAPPGIATNAVYATIRRRGKGSAGDGGEGMESSAVRWGGGGKGFSSRRPKRAAGGEGQDASRAGRDGGEGWAGGGARDPEKERQRQLEREREQRERERSMPHVAMPPYRKA